MTKNNVWLNDKNHVLHPYAEYPEFGEKGSRVFEKAMGFIFRIRKATGFSTESAVSGASISATADLRWHKPSLIRY